MFSSSRPAYTASPQAVVAGTWRPAVELWAVLFWFAAAALSFYWTDWEDELWRFPVVCGSVCSILALFRFASAFSALKTRAALAGSKLEFRPFDTFAAFLETARKRNKAGDRVWFGRGFAWQPEHAQKLYELTKTDVAKLIPPALLCRLINRTVPKDPDAVGLAAIDGLSARKEDIWVSEKTLEGGTLIVGTTQAGKGVMLTNLVTQAVLRGDAVIIIDPKNSGRLREAVENAARKAGRTPPLFFHPNNAGGVSLNPLDHFARPSELASRITAVMTETGPFTAFAWSAVNVIVNLMLYVGIKPTIAGIESALTSGLEEILLEAMRLAAGDDALSALQDELKLRGLTGREAFLFQIERFKEAFHTPEALEKAFHVYCHDPAHYAKITASLMPVLAMLTSGTLRRTLSGTPETDAVSLSQILEDKGILYVCLNSLPDPTVAGAIGALILSDLAGCAGERYNNAAISRTRVSLFVDECANVINRSLIEILNKGAESGLRTTCAMQTVSDLSARLGSENEARMALGNFNSLICLRTKDRTTQEFVAETFGRTYIANSSTILSNASRSEKPGDFSASVARQVTSTREEIIPSDILGKLPNCEFFASLAGGRLMKGRIPIITSEEQKP